MKKNQNTVNRIDRQNQGIILWDQLRRNPLTKPFLFSLSLVYKACISIRHMGYDYGLLQARRLPCMVISVGNLTVGGTGKTPVARMIAELLLDLDRHPVILSRGYKRQGQGKLTVVSDPTKILVPPEVSGDEPYMLAQWLPGTPVIVGKNRYDSGIFALNHFDTDCVILDDGFQHLGLFRDLDIVVINAGNPFDQGRLLPYGHLRESLAALKRASLILLNKVEPDQDLKFIQDTIRQYNQDAPVCETTYTPECLVSDSDHNQNIPLSSLKDCSILVFSGIADPASLLKQLKRMGARIEKSIVFSDHHWFSHEDIQMIQKIAKKYCVEYVVTTEKDGVRLPADDTEGIYILKMKMGLKESNNIMKEIVCMKSAGFANHS